MQRQLPPNRIEELSERVGFKRYDLAARYRVDPSTVYRWQTGQSPVPDSVKLDLAAYFAEQLGEPITVSYLMGWDRDPGSAASEAA